MALRSLQSEEGAWDSLVVSIRSNDGRYEDYSSRSEKGPALRARGSVDLRRRVNSEGGTPNGAHLHSLRSSAAKPSPRRILDRRLVSEKCVAMADHTQKLLFDAWELYAEMQDMPLWVHSHVVPLKWRRQVLAHLEPIHTQMTFCRDEVVQGWGLLHPPFYQPSIDSFERRLGFFARSVQLLTTAIQDCKARLLEAETLSACRYIQLWTRRLLAKRGFYTKVLKLSYHHRGVVAGMFDTIGGNSKLTMHRPAQRVTLEYPRSDKNWDSFSSRDSGQ